MKLSTLLCTNNKIINKDNFHINTRCVFQRIKWGSHAQSLFNELIQKSGVEVIRPYASGSVYIIDGDDVYRCADHWDRVASCYWPLDRPMEHWRQNEFVIGKANFSQFKQY